MLAIPHNHKYVVYAQICVHTHTYACTHPPPLPPHPHTLPQPLSEVSVLRDQWRVVFIIAAELYLAGAIIYSVLASGEVQSWATEDGEDGSGQTKVTSVGQGCETSSLPRGLMDVR